MKEKILSKLKEIMICNQYRSTYVIREENLPYLADELVKLCNIPHVSGSADVDLGHGKCVECGKRFAKYDYNKCEHWVCEPCYDALNLEFDDEYR